jgi:hypothetical protein
MVGGALERGESEVHDRRKFRLQWYVRRFFESPAPTPHLPTTFFALCRCVSFFLLWHFWRWWGIVVQCLSN